MEKIQGLLNACILSKSVRKGRAIHCHIIKNGESATPTYGNRLLDMYSKCEIIKDARQVFDGMTVKSTSSYNAIITAYCKTGLPEHARKVFDTMPERNTISWNAMLSGYARQGHGTQAMELFKGMHSSLHKEMNTSTYATIISLNKKHMGVQIHAHVVKSGDLTSDVVVGSALLAMYAGNYTVEFARQVFDEMAHKNVVTWTSMIRAYAQGKCPEHALMIYSHMVREENPNGHTLSVALNCCAELCALQLGEQIHVHAIRAGVDTNVFVASALMDMYAKCGLMSSATALFLHHMPKSIDNVMLNTMIVGYANNGQPREALALFNDILLLDKGPTHLVDGITFMGVLLACSHAGMVEKAMEYFNCMESVYGVVPESYHYSCIVDILGRTGRIDEAKEMMDNMPFAPDFSCWLALLGVCRVHGKVEMARVAAENLVRIDPNSAASVHAMLCNVYAGAGMWEEVAMTRRMMKDRKKQTGCSWIEVKGRVHSFVVEDKSHPMTSEIYEALDKLFAQSGYVSNTHFSLHQVHDDQKGQLLRYHSEKLAFAFGFIATPPTTPIRIMKNLSICGDCHEFFKLISGVVNREIVVRDNNRFHHFKDSYCSCKDYWL